MTRIVLAALFFFLIGLAIGAFVPPLLVPYVEIP